MRNGVCVCVGICYSVVIHTMYGSVNKGSFCAWWPAVFALTLSMQLHHVVSR
jgi:hypothetical protein